MLCSEKKMTEICLTLPPSVSCERLDVSQPYGPSQPVAGRALPFTLLEAFIQQNSSG
jgi:hypothetical protein